MAIVDALGHDGVRQRKPFAPQKIPRGPLVAAVDQQVDIREVAESDVTVKRDSGKRPAQGNRGYPVLLEFANDLQGLVESFHSVQEASPVGLVERVSCGEPVGRQFYPGENVAEERIQTVSLHALPERGRGHATGGQFVKRSSLNPPGQQPEQKPVRRCGIFRHISLPNAPASPDRRTPGRRAVLP